MSETTVVDGTREDGDAWIDRRTIFGNPFKIQKDGGNWTREESVEAYKDYFKWRIENDDEFRTAVDGLKGKTLMCHCKPKLCHGDVIASYLNTGNVDYKS